MKKLINIILKKLLRKKLFVSVDIAEPGQYYSCFRLLKIDKDGVFNLKKIKHSSD